MINIILFALIVVLLCFAGYFGYKNLKGGGCCGNHDSEKKIRVHDKNPAHYPYQVQMEIGGMTCNHCKQRVENALNSEDGVWAEVNLKAGKALVRMKQQINDDELRRDVTREGYTVKSIQQATA